MKKYKKLFVVVLSLMMVFTMIPASVGIAFAEDNIGEDSFVVGENDPGAGTDDGQTAADDQTVTTPADDGQGAGNADGPGNTGNSDAEGNGDGSDNAAKVDGSAGGAASQDNDIEEPSDDESVSSDGQEPVSSAAYTANEDVEALTVHGKAAQSKEEAVKALKAEGLDKDEAARLAEKLFEDARYPGEKDKSDDEKAVSADGTTIEDIGVEWYVDDKPYSEELLNISSETDKEQTVKARVWYELSGDNDYAPGDITITVPADIFKDGSGKEHGSVEVPYPEDPSKKEEFNWTQTKAESGEDAIVLTNTGTFDSNTQGFFEIAFEGLTYEDLSDMNKSASFDALIEVETEHKTISLESNTIKAQFDTPSDSAATTNPGEGTKESAPMRTAVSDDNNIKLDVNFKAGATLKDGNWVKTVENTDIHQQFQYHIAVDINRNVYSQYKKESIEITIPFSILKHMTYDSDTLGYNPPNTILENSSSCCILDGSVVSEANKTPSDDWYYKQVTKGGKKYYVIINNKDMSEIDANTVQFDVIYQTTANSYAYADYNKNDLPSCASNPFDVHLEATNQDGVMSTVEESGPKVYMDTSAVLKEVKKEVNTTWENVVEEEDGDETKYLYIQYKITAKIHGNTPSSKPTEQFDVTFDDGYDGAFTNMLADYNDDGQSDAEYEFVGYSTSGSTDETKYKLTSNTLRGYSANSLVNGDELYMYALVRVKMPDSLTINYTLDNKAKVTLHPRGGVATDTTKEATAKWSIYYKNTSPTGRFMIHKWANTNYNSTRHSRRDAYGVSTNYRADWGHENNELDLFRNGEVDYLRGFRYFIWYEGYSVRYTPYTTPHELTYSFEDQDIGIGHNVNSDANFKAGKLSSQTYNNVTKTALSAEDYFFSEIDFYPEATNATYNTEKEKWITTKSGNPFAGDEPIIIEAQFGSKTAAWTPVAKVKYSKDYAASKSEATGEIVWTDPRVDVSFGEYEGEKYNTKDTGFMIKFSGTDCVGYRIVHTNDHYYFMCNVKPTVNLKPTTWVKGVLSKADYAYIENIADMTVYDETSTNENHQIFNFEKDAAEGGHLPNRIAGAATVTQNNLLGVHKYFTEGVTDNTNQLYRASWIITGAGYRYAGVAGVGITYPVSYEVLNKGTFFDMLPRGADIDESSIKVYKAWLNKSDYNYTQEDKSVYDAAFDDKYLMKLGEDYTYELIEGSYNGHSLNGLTMLKINLLKPGTVEDSDYRPGYSVVFDTVSYYEDLDRYGSTLLNATAFEAGNGTTYHEWGFPDNPRKKGHSRHPNDSLILGIPTTHPDREKVLDALTNLEPANDKYWFGYDYDLTTVYYNQYNVSGISKRVKLIDETTWGIRKEVEPSGQYQYRIRYATDDKTTVSDIILYDKIEGYVNETSGKSSEWFGTLNSMKLTPPRGVTVPVKYYISDKDNAVVDGNIDLTDTNVWTEVSADEDLSARNVKWVAADTTGFTLQKNSSMSLILTMTAPADNESDKIRPITYNDSHVKGIQHGTGSTASDTDLSNVSNQTQVLYSLGGDVLIEKVDENGEPLRNVTFTLAGTSSLLDDEGNPAEVEMTAKTNLNGRAVFSNVPISGTGYYTLSETVPSGYVDDGTTWKVEILPDTSTMIDGEDYTGVYLRVVNKEGTEISVEKKWLTYNGKTNAPSGAKVTLTLYADGRPTEENVELDGKKDTKQPGKAGYEPVAWKATFTGLPKYNSETGNEIVYTVAETSGWPGFLPSTTEPVEDGAVITNTEETVDLWADKRWLHPDGSLTPPEGATINFLLVKPYRTYYMSISGYNITLDGIVDEEPEIFGAYESEPWKATFKNAPKYEIVDGEVVEIDYKIQEMSPYFEDWSYYNGYMVSSGGTITNRPSVITKHAYKRWRNVNGTLITPPAGATVTLSLYADGEPTGLSCVLDGTADPAPEDTTVTYAQERYNWSAYFVNLRRYKYVDGVRTEIVYTIKETAGWQGYTASTEEVESAGILYNDEEATEVTAEKEWDTNGSNIPPEGATVKFTLVKDASVMTSYSVTLDGTPDDFNSRGYEYEPWKAKFPDLSKYRFLNGEAYEIVYKVKETVTYPGYDPYPSDTVENGGVITNVLHTTDVTVTKAWKNADGSTDAPEGGTAVFRLYADGERTNYTVTLDGTADSTVPTAAGGYEYEAWKAKFMNLPSQKIVNGRLVEITYTVKEETGWPGYEVYYPDDGTFAIDGEVIRNDQKFIDVTVTKAWKNADGTTGAPDDAEVTFTLYADNEPTNYSVTLDGTADTNNGDGTAAYEEAAWEAVFVNLPQYKNVDGKEVLIAYTVKETGTWPTYTVVYGDESTTYAVDGETITNTQTAAVIDGTKTIENRKFKEDDVWTFKLEPISGSKNGQAVGKDAVPMPLDDNGDRKPVDEFVLDKDSGMVSGESTATFAFGEIYFTSEDIGYYDYKVTETAGNREEIIYDSTEYTVRITVSQNEDGTLKTEKSIIAPENAASVNFTNKYNAEGSTHFDGTKTITGRSFKPTDSWVFVLEPVSGTINNAEIAKKSVPMPLDGNGNRKETVTYVLNEQSGMTAGETTAAFTFEEILYDIHDVVGVFKYKITETAGNINGIVYDTRVYTVTVTVKDNGDGTLDITKKYTYPGFKPKPFDGGGKLTLIEKIEGLFDELTPIGGGGISIEPIDPGHGGGTVKPLEIETANAAFTNTYNPEGTAEVLVTKGLNDWGNAEQFEFVITPADSEAADGTLIPADNVSLPEDENGNISDTAVVTKENKDTPASFGTIYFFEEGTFNYVINEVIPDEAVNAAGTSYADATDEEKAAGGFTLDGITYDGSDHTVQIVVTDPDKDGTLHSAITYDGAEATSAVVTNSYDAKGSIDLYVDKKIDGREYRPGDAWTFTVTGSQPEGQEGEVPMPADGNGNPVTSVTITEESGYASEEEFFGTITYTYANAGKTYNYTIAETVPDEAVNADGVKYSEATDAQKEAGGFRYDGVTYAPPQKVTVTVTDNHDGTLTVTKSPDRRSYTFTNVYNAIGTGELGATKAMQKYVEGGTPEAYNLRDEDEFTFILTAVNGAPMPLDATGTMAYEVKKTADKDNNWSVLFGEITYTEAKTYTYEIREQIPDEAFNADGIKYGEATDEQKAAGGFMLDCVVYDSTVHTATVKVSENDPKNGILNVEVLYDAEEVAQTGGEEPGDGGTTEPAEPVLEGEETLTIINTFLPPRLSLTKKMDTRVDTSAVGANATIVFKVEGKDGKGDTIYNNHLGIIFDDESGAFLSKVLEDIPYEVAEITVTEEYTGNYNPTSPASGESTKATLEYVDGYPTWVFEFENKPDGHNYSGGVTNKYGIENGENKFIESETVTPASPVSPAGPEVED